MTDEYAGLRTAVVEAELVGGESGKFDQQSQHWVDGLMATGEARQHTSRQLYELLVRAARAEAHRRGNHRRVAGAELDDLAHHAAADALLTIIRKVSQFRGESQFLTWAYKFVIFEVSTKLNRHFWRRAEVPFDAEDWDRLPTHFGFDPQTEAEWRELLAALRHAINTALTPRQRLVIMAVVLNDAPIDALAEQLGSTRNAIYKVGHDARRKLRAALTAAGYLTDRRSA